MVQSSSRRAAGFAAVAGAAVLALAVVAPALAQSPAASPGAGGGKLFVAINKEADQQYFIDLQNSFVSTIESLGGTAQKYDAKDEAQLGVNLVNDAISKGAAGISITVPDQGIGPAIATAAAAAGVPLIATDDSIVDAAGAPIPFVGFDGTDMGNKVGAEAARLLTASGWLTDGSVVGMLSVEKEDLSVCKQRTDAQKAAVTGAGLPAAQVLSVPGLGTVDGAFAATGPVIAGHPDVTKWVVTGCNDESVLGASNALAAAGVKPEDVIGVGLGAYEACKPWAAGQPTAFKSALFISGLDVGKAAATVLYDNVVNGVALPEKTIANTTMVTPETFKDVMDPVSLTKTCGVTQ